MQRRAAVQAFHEKLDVAERFVYRWIGVNRKLVHDKPRRRPDEPLRSWLIDKAAVHRRFGQRRLIVLARREGCPGRNLCRGVIRLRHAQAPTQALAGL